jgi:TolB protein
MKSQNFLLGLLIFIFCLCQSVYGLHTVEFEVCTAVGTQASADIEEIFIVWQDNRNGDWDIYGYDLQTKTEYAICTADGNQTNPSIGIGSILDEEIIAWEDDRNGNSDIYGYRLLYNWYDLGLGEEIVICDDPYEQRNPVSEGAYVYWQDNRGGDWDIYGMLYEDEQEANEVVICGEAGAQINPSAYYEVVAWQDNRGGDWDIYAYDVEEANEWAICNEDGNQTNPSYGGYGFVWEDDRNGNEDIYLGLCSTVLCDFNELFEYSVCIDSNSQRFPDICYHDVIVWQDERGGSWDIYGYAIEGPFTGTEFVVSAGEGDRVGAEVDSYMVVWQDGRVDDGDIYAACVCATGNDDCGGYCAIELFDEEAYFGSTEGMGMTYWGDSQEPLSSSCGFNDYKDAWHVYRPVIGGPVTITTEGSSLDTILSVYNSCYVPFGESYEDPIELACNDDYCLAHAGSKVALDVVKGKSYHIRVSGFNDETGDYRIVVERGAATEPIRSDLNGDEKVDMLDFAIFSSEWLMGN